MIVCLMCVDLEVIINVSLLRLHDTKLSNRSYIIDK